MSNLTLIENIAESERTPAQAEALMMHQQLHMHKGMVAVGLAGMCQDLKIIRDKKLYLELGYERFEEYTEVEHGIKERQAYKYIRAIEQYGFQFLHSSANADIGVTKLLEIAVLSGEDRNKLLSEHTPDELAAMSTPEVKALVAEIADLKKQLSFFEEQEETINAPTDEIDDEIRKELEAEIRAEYEMQIEKLKEKVISDEELKKYKAEAEKEAKSKAAEELKDFKNQAKAAEAKAKEASAKLAEAEKQAKEAKETADKANALQSELQAFKARSETLEKQIKISANPELTRFKYLFEDAKASLAALVSQYAKLDEELKPKMKAALEALVGGLKV